ncbi:MAG: hypothetical protein ACOH1X_11160 [Kaistella sp.]
MEFQIVRISKNIYRSFARRINNKNQEIPTDLGFLYEFEGRI